MIMDEKHFEKTLETIGEAFDNWASEMPFKRAREIDEAKKTAIGDIREAALASIKTEEIIFKMKELEGEFDRMRIAVRDLGEAFSDFQEKLMEAESKFGMFRRLYWKIKEQIEGFLAAPTPPISDDRATIPPPGDPIDPPKP